MESEFLSNDSTKQSLQDILHKLLKQLNEGECSIRVSRYNLNPLCLVVCAGLCGNGSHGFIHNRLLCQLCQAFCEANSICSEFDWLT